MEFKFEPNESTKNPLKEYGRNLTDEAVRGNLDPVIGRDDEIRRIIRILSRKTKNNPLLIGEPGVGKTAIIEGLAQRIINGNVPENLKDMDIIELDIPSLIAGASFQGQFEKRLKDLLKAIKKEKGKVIVFIDEIHMIVGTGKNQQGGMDAAQILKPMLARGELRLIGATTADEYRIYIEKDGALERRLQKIYVSEPSLEEATTILRGLKERLESYHKVIIHDRALVEAVYLSDRYITNRYLPDKAIDIVDEAAAMIQTMMHSKPEDLEKAENKLAMYQMEKRALLKEEDAKSKQELKELEEKLSKTIELVKTLSSKWENEKQELVKISKLKEKIEAYRLEQQKYQAEGKWEEASVLLYKELPTLEKELKKLEQKIYDKHDSLSKEEVTEKEIVEIVSKWTNIPIQKLIQTQKEKLLLLSDNLKKRIKGQDHILNQISDVILRSRTNINDPNRPLGSFIFMGPTGVGKTLVAKTLANELFDNEKNLVRIDMSEYMERHSVSKLFGTSPGYIGYEQGGVLTEAIKNKPYSIVLFDEIEKAHKDVLNVLLQILDEGHLTDNRNKTINFKNTIIIMTTNIAAIEILEKKPEKEIKRLLNKNLNLELINRIDEILIFNPLEENALKEIAKLELDYLIKRLNNQNIYITFDDKVIDKIAKDGFDLLYGARPIKRYIVQNIENMLARKILEDEIVENIEYIATLNNQNQIIYEEKDLY